MTRDDLDRLAAEYVLGLLEGEERAEAERRLAEDRGFPAMVETWRRRFAELDETAPQLPPDEGLWRRIDAAIAGPAPRAAVQPVRAEPRLRLWDNLFFWRGLGLAGAFAALLLALGLAYTLSRTSRQPVMIAVLLNDSNQPGAVLSTYADGHAELVPLGDMTIPHNHSIQIWTFPDPKGAPVSVGVISVPRSTRLDMDKMPRLHSDQLFAISVEPLNGSPTGQPTGPVVMKGTASTAL
ncbi:anti-sigma factor [Microvirga thermotolerans]|uniref:Anti-sigma K factor RskA C-terminal domain-containing protein n=1 Tax=Microvirga thermotolerans TaxID=2651334 RepID=A0A5P9K4E2_9HYPH|nr:anti-sigma factor [Microvirga thermotolerans]QFU17244.1 hypothetical protein GDR74_14005 [Microvirga thermotolerans]